MSDYPNKGIASEHKRQLGLEAKQRQADRDKRTPAEQLAILVDRGHSHCKEAAKLRELIKADTDTPTEDTPVKKAKKSKKVA